MSEQCTHDCSTCSANCSSREKQDLQAKLHDGAAVKNVIAIVSGKGGVGKSLVTSLLAVNSARHDYETAILDADVTGPSIPKAFGLKQKAMGDDNTIYPVITKTGIQCMSVNLLLEDDTDPVVWRGPVIAGAITQFWSDTMWENVDYMYVDMPPGTGDVPLTVFQSLPVKGIVIVTSPQELVGMIVEKAVKMAEMMNVPILGIVENMSYFECPDCHKQHHIFGDSKIDEIAKKHGIDTVCKLPINPALAKACDNGIVELYNGDWLDKLTDKIEKLQ